MDAKTDFTLAESAASAPRPRNLAGALRRPNLAIMLALAWGLVALQLLIPNWAGTADTLSDTDDAMRLVELRAYLSGAGWFDLHEARIAPPFGYVPHWSRLIDAGLAGLFILFRPFTDAAMAERLMRAAWPVLWLIPAMAGAMAVAARLAGREGGLIALLFAVVGLPAFQQFVPGRVDHHNVQIALVMLMLAATVWSDRKLWSAAAAGLVSALALAIGFECLPFVVACGAALALRFVADGAAGRALTAYGLALAGAAAAAFLVDVGPDRLMQTACDSMAINAAAALMVAGMSLALTARAFAQPTVMRFAATALAGAAGAIVYVAIEPRCLGGPFAMMDPAVWAIWLAHVQEMQPVTALMRDEPAVAAMIAAFPAFAVLAGVGLARDRALRGDFAFLVVFALLLLACALTLATAKMYSYAMWVGMPLATLVAVRLNAALALSSPAARTFTAMLFGPAVISAVAIAAVQAAAPAIASPDGADKRACFKTGSYARMAALPKGLVVADIDHGPFILALTPHAALAGPYHRMSAAIVATHEIFARPPDQSRASLARVSAGFGATYVALCGRRAPAGLSDTARAASLWGRLKAGDVPDWLERLPSAPDQAFAVYRIRR